MVSKVKVDAIESTTGSGTIALNNQFSGMTASSMPTGSVLQVVQGRRTSRATVNTTTFTDVGVSATITPKSTSSKILVHVEGSIGNANSSNTSAIKLFRGSTEIGAGTGGQDASSSSFILALQSEAHSVTGISNSILDEPATTSAVIYKIQLAGLNGTASVGGRGDQSSLAMPTTITLTEIAG